jgi:hypothetical protein
MRVKSKVYRSNVLKKAKDYLKFYLNIVMKILGIFSNQ